MGWNIFRIKTAKEVRVTIASWLVTFDAGQGVAVRQALSDHADLECRSEAKSSMVVLSQSPPGARLEGIREILEAAPGVRDTALVTAFEDDEAR